MQARWPTEILVERNCRHAAAARSDWQPVGADTKLHLSSEAPLGPGNPVALVVTSSGCPDCTAGAANRGYWGLGLAERGAYHISLYLRAHDNSSVRQVRLLPTDGH